MRLEIRLKDDVRRLAGPARRTTSQDYVILIDGQEIQSHLTGVTLRVHPNEIVSCDLTITPSEVVVDAAVIAALEAHVREPVGG